MSSITHLPLNKENKVQLFNPPVVITSLIAVSGMSHSIITFILNNGSFATENITVGILLFWLFSWLSCATMTAIKLDQSKVAKDPVINLAQEAIEKGTLYLSKGILFIDYKDVKIQYDSSNIKFDMFINNESICDAMNQDQEVNIRRLLQNEAKKMGLKNLELPEVQKFIQENNNLK